MSDTTVVVGNASDDGAGETRGWFVGHFLPPSVVLRRTEAVEVKWGVHPSGESRPSMAMGTVATTLSVLVSGAFRVVFPDREVLLSRPGDYVLFPPGVLHGWAADADSVVLTVRWPSRPGDSVELRGEPGSVRGLSGPADEAAGSGD
jgi:hypothetical protein